MLHLMVLTLLLPMNGPKFQNKSWYLSKIATEYQWSAPEGALLLSQQAGTPGQHGTSSDEGALHSARGRFLLCRMTATKCNHQYLCKNFPFTQIFIQSLMAGKRHEGDL